MHVDIKWVFAKMMKALNPPALKNCRIDRTAKVCPRSELTNVTMDRYSYIGSGCFMVNVKIGAFCSVADRVAIGGAAHPIQYVSSSPVFHSGKNILKKNFSRHPSVKTPQTTIENDVWIGMGSMIKAGVTVHHGAVIGMGSVVTHDVPAYEIWAGNPARYIKRRFSEDVSKRLEESGWWDLDAAGLESIADVMNDPAAFLARTEDGGKR